MTTFGRHCVGPAVAHFASDIHFVLCFDSFLVESNAKRTLLLMRIARAEHDLV